MHPTACQLRAAERFVPDVDLPLDCQASIGDSPIWVAPANAIYWIDVKERALRCLDAEGTQRRWGFDLDIGAFALRDGGASAVVALRDGLLQTDLATGNTIAFAAPPFDPAVFRFNDGICHASGRFRIVLMLDPCRTLSPPSGTRRCIASLSRKVSRLPRTGATCIAQGDDRRSGNRFATAQFCL